MTIQAVIKILGHVFWVCLRLIKRFIHSNKEELVLAVTKYWAGSLSTE